MNTLTSLPIEVHRSAQRGELQKVVKWLPACARDQARDLDHLRDKIKVPNIVTYDLESLIEQSIPNEQ